MNKYSVKYKYKGSTIKVSGMLKIEICFLFSHFPMTRNAKPNGNPVYYIFCSYITTICSLFVSLSLWAGDHPTKHCMTHNLCFHDFKSEIEK